MSNVNQVQNLQLQHIARAGELQFADIECGTSQHFQATQYSATTDSTDQTNAAGTVQADRRYLVASITKPLVAMGVLKLAAEGRISLSERMGAVLPEFSKAVHRRITVRHLLTHTSGFPDMLPNNKELRAAHASLGEFQQHAASAELEFITGSDCRYSSLGFLILGAMIEQITSLSAGEYLQQEFFGPLNMTNTWLGLTDGQADEVVPTLMPCLLPIWQPDAENWGWNSRYWRMLGAPWGGMISSSADLGKFARMLLSDGVSETGRRVLSTAVIQASFNNQLEAVTREPGYVGSLRPWGFGWRRQWSAHHASFGDFVSAKTVGHWGATGTLMWIDPMADNYAVFLTTTPYEQSQSVIQRMSNFVSVR